MPSAPIATGAGLCSEVESFLRVLFTEQRDVSLLFHRDGVQLEFPTENEVFVRTQTTLAPSRIGSWEIENIWRLHNDTVCATVKGTDETVSVVLLKAPDWLVISMMTCTSNGPAPDVAQVVAAAGKYMSSNRAADGEAMGRVFHPVSRLTYVDDHGTVHVFSQPKFCDMVANRWTSDKHRPFAHLRHDERVRASDEVLGVCILGPRHAIVKLTVGFPPLLYVDVLFFAKIGAEWYIVAKSSVNVPFLVDEARLLDG